jgi:amidase
MKIFTTDELGRLDATELAGRISAGELSATESIESAITRLESVEHQLGATVVDRFAEAREDAEAEPYGPFAGVPIVVKDNTDLSGFPTLHGSRAVAPKPAPANAAIVQLLLGTGAIPIAKSKLPEFGLTSTTESSFGEPARNPWDTEVSAGGSSGGSAALVAAGVVPIGHANDGGGSIRIPASCCGLVGLKPSRGRLPAPANAASLPIDIAVDGVVTRSVRDTIGFYVAVEQSYRNPDLRRIGPVQRPGSERLRIAMLTERHDGSRSHPDNVAAAEAAAAACEELGHRVDEIPSMVTQQMADDFLLYWAMLAAAVTHAGRWTIGGGFDRRRLEPLTLGLRTHAVRRAHRIPSAIRRLRGAGEVYDRLFENYDILLSPTLSLPPVPIGHLALDLDFGIASERLLEYCAFTPMQNVIGAPAISLPLGRSSSGLPIGVQFAAGIGDERRLLELALALEEIGEWPNVWTDA